MAPGQKRSPAPGTLGQASSLTRRTNNTRNGPQRRHTVTQTRPPRAHPNDTGMAAGPQRSGFRSSQESQAPVVRRGLLLNLDRWSLGNRGASTVSVGRVPTDDCQTNPQQLSRQPEVSRSHGQRIARRSQYGAYRASLRLRPTFLAFTRARIAGQTAITSPMKALNTCANRQGMIAPVERLVPLSSDPVLNLHPTGLRSSSHALVKKAEAAAAISVRSPAILFSAKKRSRRCKRLDVARAGLAGQPRRPGPKKPPALPT